MKDPVQDRVVWLEYLETVVKERDGWTRPLPRLPRARLSRERAGDRAASSVFGVRHHGPGSARASAARARASCSPTSSLIEGPPEADALVRARRRPRHAAAGRALVYAAGRRRAARRSTRSPRSRPSGRRCAGRSSTGSTCASSTCRRRTSWPTREDDRRRTTRRDDEPPTARTAASRLGAATRSACSRAAAGYDDPERWWEDVVEHRRATRSASSPPSPRRWPRVREGDPPRSTHEARREAHMRRRSARAAKDGRERIAVVCGAWHAPALDPAPSLPASRRQRAAQGAAEDQGRRRPGCRGPRPAVVRQRLRRRRRVARLVRTTSSPPPTTQVVPRGWSAVARAAARRGPRRLARLRHRGRPARRGAGRPPRPAAAGPRRADDAARRCSCGGDDAAAARSSTAGSSSARCSARVPEATPMVPLAADLAGEQRTLRLKPRRPSTIVRARPARATDLRAPRCCTGSRCSASAGAAGATRRHDRHLQGGVAAAWQPELAVA